MNRANEAWGNGNEQETTKVGGVMRITRFEDIEAWEVARKLTQLVYGLAKRGHFMKDFGLRDQACRASVSIMANIAEGFDSGSNLEFVRFLSYAQRSCSELQ